MQTVFFILTGVLGYIVCGPVFRNGVHWEPIVFIIVTNAMYFIGKYFSE